MPAQIGRPTRIANHAFSDYIDVGVYMIRRRGPATRVTPTITKGDSGWAGSQLAPAHPAGLSGGIDQGHHDT